MYSKTNSFDSNYSPKAINHSSKDGMCCQLKITLALALTVAVAGVAIAILGGLSFFGHVGSPGFIASLAGGSVAFSVAAISGIALIAKHYCQKNAASKQREQRKNSFSSEQEESRSKNVSYQGHQPHNTGYPQQTPNRFEKQVRNEFPEEPQSFNNNFSQPQPFNNNSFQPQSFNNNSSQYQPSNSVATATPAQKLVLLGQKFETHLNIARKDEFVLSEDKKQKAWDSIVFAARYSFDPIHYLKQRFTEAKRDKVLPFTNDESEILIRITQIIFNEVSKELDRN